jgi:hypothetical protein
MGPTKRWKDAGETLGSGVLFPTIRVNMVLLKRAANLGMLV